MTAAIIIFIPAVLLVILLCISIILQVFIQNNEITTKLIIFKVIKINIKEKTTFEKIKKRRALKEKVPIKKIIEIINESLPGIRYLASKTDINIRINGTFGLSSADKTALTVGIMNMILYIIEGIIKNYMKGYTGEYNFIPDYANETLEYSLFAEIKVKPMNILVFLIKWLKILLKYKKYIIRKGGASNAGSSNRRINENYNG